MQPRNEFRPCRRCGIRIAADLLTGDPLEENGSDRSGRLIYRWHQCAGKLSPDEQKIARQQHAAELALRYPRLPDGPKLKSDDVAPGASK